MLSALSRGIAQWFRTRGRRTTRVPPGRSGRRAAPLTVEVLEERCLLSAAADLSANLLEVSVPLGDVLMALQPKGNPSVVFLGDSITFNYAYGGGSPVWNTYLAPLGAVDYGVSGQTTQSLLYQLNLGQLVGINPSLVVLMIGTNDVAEGLPPLLVAAGIVTDVNAIHLYLPQTQVLVLGTPPGSANPGDGFRVAVNQTNDYLSTLLAGDPLATYLNVAPAFENADGTISPLVLSDGIHPTELGFLNLTSVIYPTVYKAVQANNPVPLVINAPPLAQI